ncbi:MAG: MFS transporter, partial [Acidimicrobiales bacterium]
FPTFLHAHPFIATYLGGLGFLGALVGSLARPVGGWLADRYGGARVTVAMFCAMAVFTAVAVASVESRDFGLFLSSFTVVFAFTGMGNGSIYKLIPSVFAARACEATPPAGGRAGAALELKRQAAAVIGFAGAAGALGGVGVQVALRQASLHVSALEQAARTPALRDAIAATHSAWSVPALCAFGVSYLAFASLTWAIYLRYRSPRVALAEVTR